MNEPELRKANKKKEKEKTALVEALSQLLLEIPPLISQGKTEAAIVQGVVQATPNVISLSLRIIPKLHKEKLLGQYITEELQPNGRLDDPKFQSIVDHILAVTPAHPPEPPKVPVRSSSPATVAPYSSTYKPYRPEKTGIDPRVFNATYGVMCGGIIIATAGMILAAKAFSVGGLTASGFPPAAGVLLTIGGGLLLLSLAFLAYYAYQNRGNKSFASSFGNAASAVGLSNR